jgi:anti-anti-sigma factor
LVVEAPPGGELTLRLCGELDLHTIGPVRGPLLDRLRRADGPVTVDLSQLTHLASAGVRLLAEALLVGGDRVRLSLAQGGAAARAIAVAGLD